MASDDEVREVIHRACLCLDREDFDGFLELCAPDFRYQVTAYSPDIRKHMIWLNQDREGLAAMFESLPQHLRRLGTLLRHVSVCIIERDEKSEAASVTSTFLVIHTNLEGQSKVFAAGRYLDTLALGADQALLTSRTTRLETRDLGIGSHVPI